MCATPSCFQSTHYCLKIYAILLQNRHASSPTAVQHIQHAVLRSAPHPTSFELRRAAQCVANLPPCAPFASLEEWELARWITDSNISQGQTEKFMQLGLVSIEPLRKRTDLTE